MVKHINDGFFENIGHVFLAIPCIYYVCPRACFIPHISSEGLSTCFCVQFDHKYHASPRRQGAILCTDRRHNQGRNSKKRDTVPQNVDLPTLLPKKKKKPYPIPLKKIQQAARADKKLAELGVEKKLEPPKNGLLVPDLIPAAYELLDDWKLLIKGLAQLLHSIPVHACR